ncbi:MAG: DUF3971 domain-containing protein [Prevotellaceae bacterium]|jgi:hypothetical protein|nr:DUF3971 domain-containing protein [Prevotellaceae bacterium]
MKKALKIILLALGCLTLLLVALAGVTVAYRNDIIAAALSVLAQNNELEVREKGVSLALSTKLSNTSLLFDSVHVNTVANAASTLDVAVDAASVYVEVNLLQFLLHKEVKIEKIVVVDAAWNVQQLTPKVKKSEEKSGLSATQELLKSLHRVQLDHNHVSFTSAGKRYEADVHRLVADLRSQDSTSEIDARGSASLQLKRGLNSEIAVDGKLILDKNSLFIKHCKLGVDNVSFEVNSTIALVSPNRVKASVSGTKISFAQLIAMGKKYGEFKTSIDLQGKTTFSIALTGALSGKQMWTIDGNGMASDVSTELADTKYVKADYLTYHIATGDASKMQLYVVELNSEKVSCLGLNIGGSATITNLDKPQYEASLNMSGSLATLGLASVEQGEVAGEIQLHARGWTFDEIDKLNAQGSVKNLRAALMHDSYMVDGSFTATKHALKPKLSIASHNASGSFDGEVQGYLNAMLRRDDTPASLTIAGIVNMSQLNVDALMTQSSSEKSSLDIRAKLNAKVKDIILFKQAYLNTSCILDYSSQKIVIDKLHTKAFGGTLNGDIKVFNLDNERKRLSGDIYFNDIQIEKVAYISNNFELASNSISGKCDGAISLSADITDKGIDTHTLRSTVNATISNGRLLNFAAIQPLGDYIHKELLHDVRFSALKNTITIDGERITIPQMEIRSTALSTVIAGTQWLNGDFDYHLTLYPSELLSGREKNIDNPIKSGKTQLFLHFISLNGKSQLGLDKQEWNKDFSKKLQQEKQTLKDLLHAQPPTTSQPAQAQQKPVNIGWEEEEKPAKTSPATPPVSAPATKKKKTKSEVVVEWEEE